MRTDIVGFQKMMLSLAVVLVLSSTLFAAEPELDSAFYAKVERAAITADKPALRDARTLLQQRTAEPQASAQLRYALAYVDWRLEHLKTKEEKKEDFFKEAQKQLEIAISADAKNADARALLSAILGERIGRDPLQGQILGPKASSLLDRAAKDAPQNPRVAMQRGVSAFFTPEAFGGSLTLAESEMRRALGLFALEPAAKPWPNWGRLDAMAWLGQILEKKGDLEGARKTYRQALAIEPEFGWVHNVLLPELEQKLAGK